MIQKLQPAKGKVISFLVSGKLRDEDYQVFVPEVEALIEREGKVRLLLQFENFHGWDLHAAWDDMVFGIKHQGDIERLAMAGDEPKAARLARLAKPFIAGEVMFFPSDELPAAWDWLLEGL
ncbi:MAG TPA: STAS/SEC14 domain-containing protein [Candidatus Tenderia sp.]|nr:STAS/SEC14 domain-containing protein [Candidatus Tenderia sp.]